MSVKQLFLIDAFGAALTVFILGFVLPEFQSFFGIPESVLTVLTPIAGVYFIYSTSCYLWTSEKHVVFLRIIAIANLFYSLITAALVLYSYQVITTLGLLYFALEVVVIVALATVELKAARSAKLKALNKSLPLFDRGNDQ